MEIIDILIYKKKNIVMAHNKIIFELNVFWFTCI